MIILCSMMGKTALASIIFLVAQLLNKIFIIKFQFDISMISLWGKIPQYLPMVRLVPAKLILCSAV